MLLFCSHFLYAKTNNDSLINKNEMFNYLKNEYEDFMFDRWPSFFETKSLGFFPRTYIQETDDLVVVEFELPGVKKNEIDLRVSDDYLTVSGERIQFFEKNEKKKKKFKGLDSKFHRMVSIPRNCDKSKAKAELKDGILKIEIPKVKVLKSPEELKLEIQALN